MWRKSARNSSARDALSSRMRWCRARVATRRNTRRNTRRDSGLISKWRNRVARTLLTPRSRALVLVVPQHRLPELDLVLVRVHDPRELAVFMRLGSLDDCHPVRTQLLDQCVHVVDAVVDHERRRARVEPLGVLRRHTPHRHAAVLGRVVRPPENRPAEAFERHAEVLL